MQMQLEKSISSRTLQVQRISGLLQVGVLLQEDKEQTPSQQIGEQYQVFIQMQYQ